MVKLSQQILVSSYSFADIVTRDRYFAFKIYTCSRSGNFLSGCQNDIFNTFVDMMRQKLSTLADFVKTEHRENDG